MTNVGYTQSGPLFRAKTRALEKLLIKALNPLSVNLTCIYPTGPVQLRPSNIPGYTPSDDNDDDGPELLDSFAWFLRDNTATRYNHFPKGMSTVATAVREAGGIDGVVGFSQGGAVAALVAAAMEEPRRRPPEAEAEWVEDLRASNGGKPLGFAVVYSGFFAPVPELEWCYEPKIQTPTLHYLGSLDTVVEEKRSKGLVERCNEPTEVIHPGGHFVPISKEWTMPIVAFIKKYAENTKQEDDQVKI